MNDGVPSNKPICCVVGCPCEAMVMQSQLAEQRYSVERKPLRPFVPEGKLVAFVKESYHDIAKIELPLCPSCAIKILGARIMGIDYDENREVGKC